MKLKKLLIVTLSVAALLALFVVAHAQSSGVTYSLIATIPIPPNDPTMPVDFVTNPGLRSWDITWIDPGTQRMYLTNRSTIKNGGRIDVIDTQANKFLYSVTGMVGTQPGFGHSGPNGVVAIPQLNQLYVGDGDSTVKVIDLAQKKVIATINTGGTARADELGYDPLDHIILIANASDNPPFLTFISADTQMVLGKYTYPPTQVGLEQPVWSKLTQRFYVTVPATAVTLGSVDVFNALTMKRENSYGIGCSPAGIVITPNQHLMNSCGAVVDVRGSLLGTVGGVGGDQIWYNSGDNRYYFGSAVVDADTNQVIATLPVLADCGNRKPDYPCIGGRVNPAVDSETNHVFTPVANAGIKVWAQTQ